MLIKDDAEWIANNIRDNSTVKLILLSYLSVQENLNILDRASAYKRPNCTDLNVLLSDSPFLLAKKSSNACMTFEVEYQRCGRSKELDISCNEALLNKFPLKS